MILTKIELSLKERLATDRVAWVEVGFNGLDPIIKHSEKPMRLKKKLKIKFE